MKVRVELAPSQGEHRGRSRPAPRLTARVNPTIHERRSPRPQVDRKGHPICIKLRKEEVKRSKGEPLEVIEFAEK